MRDTATIVHVSAELLEGVKIARNDICLRGTVPNRHLGHRASSGFR